MNDENSGGDLTEVTSTSTFLDDDGELSWWFLDENLSLSDGSGDGEVERESEKERENGLDGSGSERACSKERRGSEVMVWREGGGRVKREGLTVEFASAFSPFL